MEARASARPVLDADPDTPILDKHWLPARRTWLPAARRDRLLHKSEGLHKRGPRCFGELLIELSEEHGPELESEIHERLSRFLRLGAETYRAVGADSLPPTALRLVKRG